MAELLTKYQQYDEYKKSGIEWVGNIPSHWEETPVFSCFDATSEKNLDGKEANVLSLSYGNIIKRDVDTNFGLLPESFNTYQIVDVGDIILRLTDLQNDKRSLRVGLAKEKGIITSAYLKLKPKDRLDSVFAYRLLHSYDTTKVYYGLGGGLRQSMKFEDFRRLPILVPPYEEQVQIANFLDFETAQIDTLIEKQQTLILLLKEKRQAVISHAVTKGLNPDAPMKDSGVEWLGEVPEHWNITRIKYVAELTPSKSGILSRLEERCSFIPMEKLKLDTLILDETRQIKDVYQGYTYFEDGDVLIAKVTPCFENQNMAIAANLVNGIGFGSSEIYVLRTEAEGLNQFLLYRLQESVFMQLGAGAMTGAGGLRRVPSEFLNNFQFGLPPISEQQGIVEHIEKMKSKFNDLIDNAEQAIQLMQERRTALISAAVTGKIDVRGWQVPDNKAS